MPNAINVFITIFLGGIYRFVDIEEKRKKIIYLFVIGCCLSLVCGLRGLYATSDTEAYYSTFQGCLNIGLLEEIQNNIIDFGFYGTTWILANLGFTWQVYLLMYSFFVMGSFLYWIYDNSQDVVISLLIFECMFLTVWQSALRQTIAMAIILWSYKAIKNNKKLRAMFLFFIALTFHATAIVVLPFYLVRGKKVTNAVILIGTICTSLVFFFNTKFLWLVNKVAALLGRNVYLDFWKTKPITLIAFSILVLFITILMKKIFMAKYSQYAECYYALFLMLIFLALGGGVMVRLAWYYGIFLCILIPILCRCFREWKVVTLLVCLVLLGLYLPHVDYMTYYFCWMD